ncbi:hypothetical protein IGI04_008020 [Brassica rapa subsp. trilocularis]|uniref:DUF3741 domain-containing protein n=1 Tax=Brassica rapa subsp. trilocularis TaxID=1813537 RepID=A0ABQ7NML2_BRACM|nr:hypothetical protein IGI04_008020 [Brassica rapa subsp. trilocularis]
MTTWITSFYGRGPNNRENGLRPKRRRPGSLPDTRVKEAGDRHTCRDLEHQCDTRRPPRLDRNRFANPSEIFTDTPPSDETLTVLHRSIFTPGSSLSKEVSSDFESHQTLDRRAENHRSSSLERRHHRFADARTIEPPPKPLFFKPSYLSAESIIDLLRDLLRLKRAAISANRTLIQPELRQGKPGEDNGKTRTQKNRRPYEGLRQRYVRIRADRSPET